jgi:Flp pilus assembly protein TadG
VPARINRVNALGQRADASHMRRRLCLACIRLSRTRGIRGEKGATLLEFAVVGILFMMLTAGMMELARGVWTYNTVAHAAREGARFAIVRGQDSGSPATPAQVEAFVKSRIPIDTVTVTTTWAPDKKPGSNVQVKVDFAFSPVVPFFPAIPLTSTSRMVISY